MKFEKLELSEVIIISPNSIKDERGEFYESFNKKIFEKITNLKINFVQDNYSISKKNVLRGLHYQIDPYEQGKLVRVIKGEVYDVAIDIRKDSPTYKKYVSRLLSEDNREQMWIPPGFAHGFLVLSEIAEVSYKCTNFYSKESERSIIWNDKSIKINWPISGNPILSKKDNEANDLNNNI